MKTSVLFTLALALVVAGCNKSTRSNETASTSATTPDYTASTTSTAVGNAVATTTAAADRMSNDLRAGAESATNAMGNAANNIASTARMTQWKLNANDIQADLANNKEIIRTKDASAGAPTGTVDKSVVESLVKGRLAADSDIAALKLDVDANKQGEVKLSGKAHSAEQVGKAIALALDTEGVSKVSSKIKLDK